MPFGVDDIEQARRRLEGIVKPTPLMRSATLERMLEAEVYLKPENLQRTGSFKIRGAYSRIAALSSGEAARGVIAASAEITDRRSRMRPRAPESRRRS
jgi:threonine dehydratase